MIKTLGGTDPTLVWPSSSSLFSAGRVGCGSSGNRYRGSQRGPDFYLALIAGAPAPYGLSASTSSECRRPSRSTSTPTTGMSF
jgi:hypothetical protein